MGPVIIRELADLFLAEAFDADDRQDEEEAQRLCEIAEELNSRLADTVRKEVQAI